MRKFNMNTTIERTTKGLFDHLCRQMELLSNKEIELEEAKQQANLVKQANNVLRYELDLKKFEEQKRFDRDLLSN